MTSAPGSAAGPARLAAAMEDGDDLLAQTVAVLRVARPDPDPDSLPVSEGDRLLLDVHEQALGRPLEHAVQCPSCGTWSTLVLTSSSVGPHAPRSAWCAPGVGLREPTYADLRAADGDSDTLLARCRLGPAATPPPTLGDLAGVEGSLCGSVRSSCVECGTPVVVEVDVARLVLEALGLLRAEIDLEVHLLATGYGWDLASIERLPDDRRRRLASLVSGGRT